jgi:hypothetical protein
VKSGAPQESRAGQLLRGGRLYAGAIIAAMALLFIPAGASAASPVLEFVVPGHSLPVSFTTESGPVSAEMAGFSSLVHCAASHGEGEITGPRSTVSKYQFTGCVTEKGSHQKCKTEGAEEEEITTGPIQADLVYIDRARDEVGMLLNPGGGTYITFECGFESAKGTGPFLAPVSPINKQAMSFAAMLSQSESMQTPDEYEGPAGELLKALPMGERGSHGLVTTGVEATFTVHPSVPVEVKATTAQEIEAEQHAEEAKEQEAALQTLQAALRKQEEALKKAEEHARQAGEEAKKHEEELNAQIAGIKKHEEEEAATAAAKNHQEEEAAAKKRQEEKERANSQPPTRAQLLARALRACEKQPKRGRARCVARAHRQYGVRAKR